MSSSVPYVGGPFAGGANPDPFIDEIQMRSPAGTGRYILSEDDHGRPVYQWQPENAGQAAG
ncbi:hypothetical protein ACFW5V_32595 [Streptomyces sp. NPDC058762]|uniref:hypothetical protein n=1 Tax=Streptomyces sp. NPDC058762 TaxID=3346629 RepID=UPI0036976335